MHHGQCISEIEAEALLRSDLACAVRAVRKAVQVDLAQHQFDALVDFCFNVGRGSFLGSSLLRYVNRGEFDSAVVQFGLWVHAGGKVLPGLVRRRAAEAALFSGHGFPFSESFNFGRSNPHASTEVGVAEPESALALTGKGR